VTHDLILADESTSQSFVAGAALRLPAASVAPAIDAIRGLKEDRDIAPTAKIHCRELFAGSARLKSPFKTLDVKACQELLKACVDVVNALGARWYGSHCDASKYPAELRLVDGEQFAVSPKHLAAMAVTGAMRQAEGEGPEASHYQFAFDPDPSMIDWGLIARTQATHFSRIHPAAIELTASERPLLDLADIAAYALAQTSLLKRSPERAKWWHKSFPLLIEQMRMQQSVFSYDPPTQQK
jgi:hypothetical protein